MGDAAPLLELDGLGMTFGGLHALTGLDLAVAEKEIVSVIGPNGAGKTTVFNAITGVYAPDDGRHPPRGPEHRRAPAPQDHRRRRRPHVPEPAAVSQHDGARERHGRHLRLDQGLAD